MIEVLINLLMLKKK